jgi:hypothetical protein
VIFETLFLCQVKELSLLKESNIRSNLAALHFIQKCRKHCELSIFVGGLHFANVQAQDYQEGKAYMCIAINYFMRSNKFDVSHYIHPIGSKSQLQLPTDFRQQYVKVIFNYLCSFLIDETVLEVETIVKIARVT